MELYKSKYSDKKKLSRNSNWNDGPSRSFRNSRDDRSEVSTTVTCSDCSVECTVPFVPRTNKPIYCNDCFRKNKSDDSSNDRYSRDDRSSRYSRDDRSSRTSYRRESNRDTFRSSKSKSDKFLKKQESFYSNGSAKFNETLKQKLYEILGGKTCSNCGFKDERALGISHIHDDQTSDDIGRGGAASWGKYISAPNIAREELRVLCLNCNKITEPITQSKEFSSRSKSKKSKYFPR